MSGVIIIFPTNDKVWKCIVEVKGHFCNLQEMWVGINHYLGETDLDYDPDSR